MAVVQTRGYRREKLTYAALYARVLFWNYALAGRGIFPGDRVLLMVTDTGRGIPEHKLAQVFSPFDRLGAEQTSIEGTGLGLTLSKLLVEAMGGTLEVESEPWVGSTFMVGLPATEEMPSSR